MVRVIEVMVGIEGRFVTYAEDPISILCWCESVPP